MAGRVAYVWPVAGVSLAPRPDMVDCPAGARLAVERVKSSEGLLLHSASVLLSCTQQILPPMQFIGFISPQHEQSNGPSTGGNAMKKTGGNV